MPAGQHSPLGQLFHLWQGTLLFLSLSSFQDLFYTVRDAAVYPISFPHHVPEHGSPLPPSALPPCSTQRHKVFKGIACTLQFQPFSKQPFPQGLMCMLESLNAQEHTIFKQLDRPWWSSFDLLLNQSLHHPDFHQYWVFSASTGQQRVSY